MFELVDETDNWACEVCYTGYNDREVECYVTKDVYPACGNCGRRLVHAYLVMNTLSPDEYEDLQYRFDIANCRQPKVNKE